MVWKYLKIFMTPEKTSEPFEDGWLYTSHMGKRIRPGAISPQELCPTLGTLSESLDSFPLSSGAPPLPRCPWGRSTSPHAHGPPGCSTRLSTTNDPASLIWQTLQADDYIALRYLRVAWYRGGSGWDWRG